MAARTQYDTSNADARRLNVVYGCYLPVAMVARVLSQQSLKLGRQAGIDQKRTYHTRRAVPKTPGSSEFPTSPGSRGQLGVASVTAGVYAACVKLREAAALALDFDPAKAQFSDERIWMGNRAVRLREAVKGHELIGEDTMEYGDLNQQFVHDTFGAHFVEVGVNAMTGEIRVRRMLAVCAAGRILNPKLARSQIIGGMTMGVGAALMEELVVDTRHGYFVNHDLASYEVPVHADIPHQEVIFLDELDPTMSPLKAKGVGELGISGVAAAVANAVYNATGVRVRDYLITLGKIFRSTS